MAIALKAKAEEDAKRRSNELQKKMDAEMTKHRKAANDELEVLRTRLEAEATVTESLLNERNEMRKADVHRKRQLEAQRNKLEKQREAFTANKREAEKRQNEALLQQELAKTTLEKEYELKLASLADRGKDLESKWPLRCARAEERALKFDSEQFKNKSAEITKLKSDLEQKALDDMEEIEHMRARIVDEQTEALEEHRAAKPCLRGSMRNKCR